MKITADNKYELIDKYVKGEMDENEASEFSSIVGSNEELSAELNLIKELNEIQDFSIKEENLRATLLSIREPSVDYGKYVKYAIGLLILGLLMMFFAKAFNTQKLGTDNTPMALLEPLELTTKAEDHFEDLKVMQDFYNSGNYKSALPYIDNYLDKKPRDLDVLLAKGISLMELDRGTEAHSFFRKIESLNPRVKKYKWYMALNYRKQGQNQKANVLLQEIVNNKSYNHIQAKNLLDK